MEGPLAVNLKPASFDLPDGMGKMYLSGAVSGIGFNENNAYGKSDTVADVSNAQVFLQKVDGEFQFFVQAGVYSLPALGAAYARSGNGPDLYGPLPVANVKIAPNSNFSIEIGKLPTLIGAEYTFTYENMNIFRGLLWNQETAISRGIQANYTAGPVALSASWNDGFYSNRFNWASGAATWTINSSNTLELVLSGNLGTTDYSGNVTPMVQNNDQDLDNLIYSWTSGAWIAQGYLQYANTKASTTLMFGKAASATGGGILVNYAVPNSSINVSGRVEYITTTGTAGVSSSLTPPTGITGITGTTPTPAPNAPNTLYGPGSNAWSGTLTATWQSGIYFTRGEVSYVTASKTTPGMALGASANATSQVRFAIETGVLF
jgi:hypothetical protein